MRLSKYMNPANVIFLNSINRDEAFQSLVDVLFKNGYLKEKEAFYKAILEREKIVSTGIGMGIAIPHAKMPHFDHFFIAVGILQKPIDWNSLDGSPVRLIFMIGGPDDKQTEYLQILSSLTQSIKDEERRKKIFSSHSSQGIIELFSAI